jgi:hypothetical protein
LRIEQRGNNGTDLNAEAAEGAEGSCGEKRLTTATAPSRKAARAQWAEINRSVQPCEAPPGAPDSSPAARARGSGAEESVLMLCLKSPAGATERRSNAPPGRGEVRQPHPVKVMSIGTSAPSALGRSRPERGRRGGGRGPADESCKSNVYWDAAPHRGLEGHGRGESCKSNVYWDPTPPRPPAPARRSDDPMDITFTGLRLEGLPRRRLLPPRRGGGSHGPSLVGGLPSPRRGEERRKNRNPRVPRRAADAAAPLHPWLQSAAPLGRKSRAAPIAADRTVWSLPAGTSCKSNVYCDRDDNGSSADYADYAEVNSKQCRPTL